MIDGVQFHSTKHPKPNPTNPIKMRRDGVRYGVRTSNSVKYCSMCVRNEHCDSKAMKDLTYGNTGAVGWVAIARFTSKPMFTCPHSQGCNMCAHAHKPYHKSSGKTKGAKKHAADKYRDDFNL